MAETRVWNEFKKGRLRCCPSELTAASPQPCCVYLSWNTALTALEFASDDASFRDPRLYLITGQRNPYRTTDVCIKNRPQLWFHFSPLLYSGKLCRYRPVRWHVWGQRQMGSEPLSSAPMQWCPPVTVRLGTVAELTSHVSRKSTVSKITFPLASFGTSSSPGWNTERRKKDFLFLKNGLPGT